MIMKTYSMFSELIPEGEDKDPIACIGYGHRNRVEQSAHDKKPILTHASDQCWQSHVDHGIEGGEVHERCEVSGDICEDCHGY